MPEEPEEIIPEERPVGGLSLETITIAGIVLVILIIIWVIVTKIP